MSIDGVIDEILLDSFNDYEVDHNLINKYKDLSYQKLIEAYNDNNKSLQEKFAILHLLKSQKGE